MSQEARLKRLGIDHLPPAERLKWLEEKCAEDRREEEETRAASELRQRQGNLRQGNIIDLKGRDPVPFLKELTAEHGPIVSFKVRK
jgi:hypothetical protein